MAIPERPSPRQDVNKDTNDAANTSGFATSCKMAISRYRVFTIITMAAVALVAAGAVLTMAGVVMYLTVTPNRQADINMHMAASHNVVTATMSRVTTTLPQVTTTLSQVTTTLSQVAIKPLQLTTKPLQMKTTQPQVTTKPLEVTTKPLQVTTIPPQVTTTLPNMTTSLQQVTTTPPRVTTASKCSKLPPPGNGAVTGSNSYRDVATFTCNPGYKLFGTSTRTCQSDGTWSGKPPTCKIVQCTSLKPPTNGIMRGANSYQGVTYFTCVRGYTPVGVKSIRCQEDGTWSDRVPTCQAIKCTKLTSPANGAVTGSNSYGDVATFTCNPGYKLVGTSTRTCQSDGTWSGGSPTCTAVQCTKRTPPKNGAVTGSNSYGDVATFTCNPGYKLVGTSTRTCQSDGTWSGGSPTCTAVLCPTLRCPANGDKRGSTSYPGSTRFTCDRGYKLVGAKSTSCQADATRCPKLTPPTNGAVTGSNSYGDVVIFACNPGYKLVGTSTRTCQSVGTWSGGFPTCKIVQCTRLTPPANGVMYGSNSYGHRATFTCNPGYKLVGTSTLTCQSDGTWSGGSPTCRVAQCTMLPLPSNGAVTGSNSYGGVITFICNPGYKLVGTSTRTCQSDGTWSGKSPTCTAECRNGYQLLAQTCFRVSRDKKNHDDALAACENEEATLAMPKTKELDVSLRNWVSKFGRSQDFWIGLKHGRGRIWQWSDGSRLDDHDYKGWNPGEPKVTQFLKSAWWSKGAGCVQYWAGGTGTHMWVDTVCSRTKRYICQASRSLIPRESVKTGDEAIRCPTLTPPANGAVKSPNSYRSVATFTCDTGYKLVGTSTRTCQSDGTWSGGSPTCKAVQCPTPKRPANGGKSGSTFYRGVTYFNCNRGYRLVGANSIRCQADGTWSGSVPTCKGEDQSWVEVLERRAEKMEKRGEQMEKRAEEMVKRAEEMEKRGKETKRRWEGKISWG
ncbi:E-selectin-like [Branchiostoma floridae]|uniref:E-selectin-like n=1 Tax=Branchiostoma floridae TaxID=7739 RepID=A0A9J7HM58_BRAFL|nr:E-selectin-like [Branchiostoma floridae]